MSPRQYSHRTIEMRRLHDALPDDDREYTYEYDPVRFDYLVRRADGREYALHKEHLYYTKHDELAKRLAWAFREKEE